MGLREKLLARRELRRERVDVPGLDEFVFVRQLTPREKDEYEASRWNQSGKKVRLDFTNSRARLVAMCVVDEAGKQVFRPHDVDALGECDPDVVEVLVDVALRINKLTQADGEKEGVLKNAPGSDSPTDSPSASAGSPASGSSTN